MSALQLPFPNPTAALTPFGGMSELELVRGIIAERYGFYIAESWSGLVMARLTARATATGRSGVQEYLRWVGGTQAQEDEITVLAETLLNGETCFLRTAPHFAALASLVIPAWRAHYSSGHRFRIASLGCSTGEEPYSIAMVLHETLSPEELADVEITGVDVSGRSLTTARTGCYEPFQLRELSREQHRRWFSPCADGRLQIHPTLRSSVRFLQHNLLNPLPFAGLDAIFCRNVLIYFRPPLAASCFGEFHAALRPCGYLFLGHSESAFGFPEFFEPVQVPDGVIYQNKPCSPNYP